MRIAILTNTFAMTGGAGRIAKTYDDLLAARGHEVRVWGPRDAFRSLGKMNPFARLAFHLGDLAENRATVNEIARWKPDALITHNLTGCGFGTPRLVARKGIRWVHLLHDVQLVEPSGQIVFGESFGWARAVWRRFWSSLRHAAMGEPYAAVSPTKWLLEFHQSYGWFRKIKTEIIPNPIESRIWNLEARSPQIPDSRFQILFVGRIDRDKGILVLLDAWKKLNATEFRLVVIGEGKLLEELKSKNLPNVEFRGAQSPDDVRRAMEDAAVVIVPSLVFENQPTVILEALAAGCGIIASDVGGVKETLEGAGAIVPPGEADAIVDAITHGVMDHAPTSRNVLSHHDPDVCVERVLGVLRSNS